VQRKVERAGHEIRVPYGEVGMPLKLNRVEWTCLVFAVVVALAFLVHEWKFPSHFDASNYQIIADHMVQYGLFSKWPLADVRTYGYPYILSLVRRIAGATHVDFRVLLFAIQFCHTLRLASFCGLRWHAFPGRPPESCFAAWW
jgi:hypothetical protein